MSNISTVLDNLSEIFQTTEDTLSDWRGDGNLQFPALMGMLALKLNWTDKDMREADPLVRYYVRRHPDWYVTRGAHGGIQRMSEKKKKDAQKQAKEDAKRKMQEAIDAEVKRKEAELATQTVQAVQSVAVDSEAESDSTELI